MRRFALVCIGVLLLAGRAEAAFSLTNARSIILQGAGQVAIGDVTGDARNDLVALVGNQVYVYAQRADASFADPVVFGFTGSGWADGASDLQIADLDGDGLNDIVVGGSGTLDLAILKSNALNPGALSLELFPDASYQNSRGIAIADVDGDGRKDVIQVVSGSSSSFVRLWYGNPLYGHKGRLLRAPVVMSSAIPGLDRPVIRDVNGDQLDDLVVSSVLTNKISLYFGTGNGAFAPESVRMIPQVPSNFAVGEFSGDRRADVAWSQGLNAPTAIQLQVQQSSGDLGAAIPLATQDRPGAMWADDIDGDGDDDLVVLHAGNGVGLYLHGADGLQPEAMAGFYGGSSFAIGDLNADGCKDVAYAVQNLGLMMLFGSGCQIPVFQQADLSVALAGSRSSITAGMANRPGTESIAAPLVRFDLSVGAGILQTGVLPSGCAIQAQTAMTQRIECLENTLLPGATAALTIPLSFSGTGPHGELVATVRVMSDTPETTLRNNVASILVY